MKKYIVPYIVGNSSPWWSGIDLFNYRPHDTVCEIEMFRHENGIKEKKVQLIIGGGQHRLLLPSELTSLDSNGRSHVVITGDDDLMISPFQSSDAGFAYAPVYERAIEVIPNDKKAQWQDSKWLKFYGKTECQYDFEYIINSVNTVAMSVYNDFPDREDKVLAVGDACPSFGNCPGHPGSSHGILTHFDLNYYTHKTNVTQYGHPVTQLWETPGEVLIKDVFDVERNAALVKRFFALFPHAMILTNSVLRALIVEYDNTLDLQNFRGREGTTYNHHTHFHVELNRS